MTDALTGHDVEEGQLPEGWERAPVADLLAHSIGGLWGKEEGVLEVDVDVIRVTELKEHGVIDASTAARRSISHKQLSSRSLEEGDLLLEKSGGGPKTPVGRVGYISGLDRESVCTNFMLLMRPNCDQVLSPFLNAFLNHLHVNGGTIALQTATTNIRNIKTDDYLATPVPLPPLDEQERIVEILEGQLSRLDTVLQHINTAREKAAQFRRSLLHAAFTGALSGLNTEEGQIPDGWSVGTIGDNATVRGGKRLPKGTAWSQTSKAHPYIRATDIWDGKINESDLVFVPDEVWDSIKRYTVKNGDVLISIAGTIGRVAVVGESLYGANLTENAAMISVDAGSIDPDYLCAYLQSPAVRLEIDRLATSTTQSKLALFRIKTIEVSLPPLAEQRRIVGIINEQLSRLDVVFAAADASEKRCLVMRRSLLHSAFTGRLTEKWRETVSV